MEEWIEIEGDSKEDAVERACAALNTTRSHLKYEVVEDGNALKIRAMRVEEPLEGVVDSTAIGKKAHEFLSKLLEFFDPEVKVEIEDLEDEIRLDIQGNGTGLLIGKHGSTLEALQHLVHKAVRLDQREGKRLVVDSERYRERRKEALEGLARKLAGRARREGRPVSVEPMNAMDRRILHLALADHPDVTTKSVGEGRNRKVVVVPRAGSRFDSRRGGRSGPTRGRSSRQGPISGRPREPGRRSGPPVRQHDSFDAPAEPEADFFPEDMEDPLMEDFTEDGQESRRLSPDEDNRPARPKSVATDEEDRPVRPKRTGTDEE